jgi:predicted dehydrogenase
MAEELRAALIGFGLSGEAFHAPLIASVPGIELAAVVSRDAQRRDRAQSRYPDAELLDRAEEVWRHADRFDVAIVAAPNRAHVPLASAAIEAGLDVVVDKPLAASASAARELAELAQRHGRSLFPFQNRRWDGDLLTVGKLIEAGELGRVLRFESRFERWRPEVSSGWRDQPEPEEAGGLLYDLGSHLVDQALSLFGPATHVYGEIDNRRGASGDDDAFVALRHRSGTYSHLWMSAVAAAPGPRLRVLGTSAAYVVEDVDGQEEALSSGVRPHGRNDWGIEPESRWGRVVRGEDSEMVPSEPGNWPAFYAELERALREGGPPPVDPADAVATLEVLEAARRRD